MTIEEDFDLPSLAQAAGATYTARATTYHTQLLIDVIKKGMEHKGFSLIEAVSACPTNFGRQNKMGAPALMMDWQRQHGIPLAAWNKMTEEQRAGKFPIGVLSERTDRKEYTEAYDEVIARAQAAL